MISLNTTNIIAKLPGSQVLVQKDRVLDNPNDKTEEEKQALQKLKNRDREVRSHEAQHTRNPETISIGGPQYTYTIGPDGKVYATGGQVMVTTGTADDPKAALRKAQALKSSALASGEPSTMDLAAAGSAKDMEMEAIIKMAGENKGFNEDFTTHPFNNKPRENEIQNNINKYRNASSELTSHSVNRLV